MQVCLQKDSDEREEAAKNGEAKLERKTAIVFALQATSLSATPLLGIAFEREAVQRTKWKTNLKTLCCSLFMFSFYQPVDCNTATDGVAGVERL